MLLWLLLGWFRFKISRLHRRSYCDGRGSQEILKIASSFAI